MRLQFLGATRQVTGSRYLLEAGGTRLLIDCGLFQEREYLGRNWEDSPVPPGDIDHVVLTHAHLDHSGLIPRLVSQGFNGSVIGTRATVELAGIVLRDAGKIQEEDAAHKRRRHRMEGRHGPHPEIPLYTRQDAEAALPLFRGVSYEENVYLTDDVCLCFRDAGHILGSSMLEVTVKESGRLRRIAFSGDVGQWNKPLLQDPSMVTGADYVVVESTYGDSNHRNDGDVEEALRDAVNRAVERGGNLIVPTFAIERAQEILYYLSLLVRKDHIPHLLVFLDSPMAVNVTDVFLRFTECLDEETHRLLRSDQDPFAFPGLTLVRSVEESKAINRIRGTCIIMAGSGMCTGGRVKHHLEHQISRRGTTVLFVGYQARGTLGRQILEGHEEVRIHGRMHPVRAAIEQIHGFSAHADRDDLLHWLGGMGRAPRQTFVTHGEAEVSAALAGTVRERLGWEVQVPEYGQSFQLD